MNATQRQCAATRPAFRIGLLIGACALASSLPTSAQAQITVTTTPFTGTINEGFESFPSNSFLVNPTTIFGGAASISGSSNYIYAPSNGAPFGLNAYNAQVADGTKGLGVNDSSNVTITFKAADQQFGGYFNANSANHLVTFSFFNSSNALISAQQVDVNPSNATTGALNFFGFSSTTAFQSVQVAGSVVVMDALRANPAASAAAPEPGSIALLASAAIGGLPAAYGAGMIARRRRKTA